ncbi:MAG: putative manganese-dependent inorganic diphosphatase [Lachnospiraceae bacterium]|uniref:inorganic diphosphatase n=1 Tax=Hominiventricola filiformis TaxID=2885352 RepID=A0AAE3A7E6_9FIRM|nr:putative manganese-dependent inorganic diphosphatase [Hominiventricola filiformis]MCI6881138.1 putative manganese-dependent inorganic diphosphatase [Clostridiaceae bacterium]MDY3824973.1 putative manganese-dependent inorganic diphosphatase [Lachnospiraceae bacterium]QUO22765.1 putative manganese-dependent inorganic diphosphatase [Clostridiaceae bacterium Marseille-Q4143]RHU79996.1 putative manganese-dependent inorganic diphosphatase [Clostridiaceae bacterium OM08-6BH]MCC2126759.1 putative m
MSSETSPVYVIGHKNPDTDSICSAVAYAELKNLLHGGGYCAARAGQINQETQYVLNFFQAQAPIYVPDVMTDVSDIEIRKTQGVTGDISLKKAWNMMRALGVVTLPITDNQRLQGLITIGDIANAYMDVYDNCILSVAGTPYKNILETLDAELLLGDKNALYDRGEVVIAAANPDVMEDYIHEGDMVILGNRYESQLCAIEMNAACIIVCMGAKVSKTIQKLAQEHNCSIIVTPHDTFTVARMINQSMPISHFMKREGLVTFKVTEKTEDIKGIMGQKRYRDFPILDLDGNYIGMISRRNLLNLRKRRLILVDHNEASQTVDGIAFADILEIIDHHRIGTLETLEPVYFRNQPVGCTATIIYQMYQENGVKISKKIAGLLMAAIISDTLMFRSPTCTSIDRMAAEKLSEICGVEIEEFAIDMFSAGSDMSSRTPKEIFNQDKKKFQVGDHSFIVAQINSMNAIELEEVKEKLVPYLSERFEGLGVEMCFVMLTNIVKEDTELLCFGEKAKDVARSAFQLSPDMEHIVLKGLVSRKKQLIPSIVTVLQQ